ncbi:nuclear transport factor 2 family protein [Rufibacter hautae]|uniref:Nuclear transport factor 2 family protein n=1 Tax=Rufibacter hautae TaxID=2595005 RepID=A0A5B6TN18_9BACT|nr:nuclear transport factor 2 family protein [Rufibacter hautae]KAA3440745.1 nuclear transport factor 2 family protein [Rufibacter hautae]
MTDREEIIRNYTDSYNHFNVEGMVRDFDEAVVFENIANGETNLSLTGLQAFKAQAEQAKNYFSSRKQTITSLNHQGNQTEVNIAYSAILATDLPNGMKKGDELTLQGKSVFTFSGDKIIKLADIS